MVDKQEWKKDIAKEYIKKNVLTGNLGEIANLINSLKEEVGLAGGNEGNNDESVGGAGAFDMTEKVLKILFNEKGKQRTEIGYEFNKTKNIVYYVITEEGRKNLDILYNEMQKAETEKDLKQSLGLELKELKDEIPGSEDPSNNPSKENQENSAKDASNNSSEGNQENSTNDNSSHSSEGNQENLTKDNSNNSSETSKDNSDNSFDMNISDNDISQIAHLGSNRETRRPLEKLKVDRVKREQFLFPDGLPKSKQEMESKYLDSISVDIIDGDGKDSKITLRVHKKLVPTYKAIFSELKEQKIKIDAKSTGAYNWRKMRRGKKMSEHSYGSAIDVNWTVNGGVYGETVEDSKFFNSPVTVEIFKKYGFAWGGDRSAKSNDPMHFSYMGS